MFEYKRGSNILYFPALCMSEVPTVRDWQEGRFLSMFVCSICSWGAQEPNFRASRGNIFRL